MSGILSEKDVKCTLSRPKAMRNRGGFALLALIIAVAIVLLLYTVYTRNTFHHFAGTETGRYSDPNAYPWEEGRLFIDNVLDGYDMGGRRPPFPEQPPLNENLHYTAGVYFGGEPRGQIELYVFKDGSVTGSWTGAYEARTDRNRNYETLREYKEGFLTNDFKGNTAPLKIYKDDRGEDKSKLYFITRGEFLLREGRENRKIHGALYVTGWIDRNYTARGELFLLSSSGGVADIEIFDWGPADPNTVE